MSLTYLHSSRLLIMSNGFKCHLCDNNMLKYICSPNSNKSGFVCSRAYMTLLIVHLNGLSKPNFWNIFTFKTSFSSPIFSHFSKRQFYVFIYSGQTSWNHLWLQAHSPYSTFWQFVYLIIKIFSIQIFSTILVPLKCK